MRYVSTGRICFLLVAFYIMIRHLVFPLILFCMLCMPDASAQTRVDRYSLTVPPLLSLRELRGDQSIEHTGATANVTFYNSMWFAESNSASGATVILKTETAFTNSATSSKRDARLWMPVMFVSPGSGWVFDQATDQTDHANGDEEAYIQISSNNVGSALGFLRVTFITDNPTTLTPGNYVVTVTGTISQN